MKDRIEKIREEVISLIKNALHMEELENIRIRFLGRNGELSIILRELKHLSDAERPIIGRLANEIKDEIEKLLIEKGEEIGSRLKEERTKKESIDVTLPGRCLKPGRLHPITAVLEEIKEIFERLGFEVEEGPEIETEYYNFEGLNIDKFHPARDEWDSFYITDEILLRTHTSPVQLRAMEKRKPPVRVISPGRCFRRDAIDRSHSHTFHQVEGFMVDEDVTFGDLKGILSLFAKELFGEGVNMRFRPDYFPFTEPSADGAITCIICKGFGCSTCKMSGWLEIFGCGMIHPEVLKNVGYDSEKWKGFAFGMGVERIVMLKYGIDDIRLFLENDIRFLEQF